MPTSLTGSTIAATYDQLLHVDGGPEATLKTVYSGDGTATGLKIGVSSAGVGNISISENTISTTNTNGNLSLTPNGTGSVAIGKVAITGGSITDITPITIADGGTGASTAAEARTNLELGTIATQDSDDVDITGGSITNVVFTGSFSGITEIESDTFKTVNGGDGLNITDNVITAEGLSTDIDIDLVPKGTGTVNISDVTIAAGLIDDAVIGGTTPAAVTGTDVLATDSIGYTTGNGGTVTQATSRTTGVTLDAPSGQITLFSTTISGHGSQRFTLTNSYIEATDVVIVNFGSNTTGAAYAVTIASVAAGSCDISVHNTSNSATSSEAPVLNFVVIKGVTS